jgi:hypothetical protein
MTISGYFQPRAFVLPNMNFDIRFNKSTDSINGGNFKVTICDASGENALRRGLPLSVFTVTPTQKSQLEAFFGDLVQQLLDATGKEIFVEP